MAGTITNDIQYTWDDLYGVCNSKPFRFGNKGSNQISAVKCRYNAV